MNLYRTAAVVTVFSALEHGLGFLYRIILSRVLGSEGLGVYQVALTVFAVFLTLSSSGLPITLSRTMTAHRTRGYERGTHAATTAAICLTLAVSVPAVILLFCFRPLFSGIFSDPRCSDLFYILICALPFTCVYAIIRGNFWGNKRFFAYSLIELIEEIIMIATGVFLLVFLQTGTQNVNLAAVAVVVSYFSSFAIAVSYFIRRGGKIRSPKGELLPLFRSSLPVTVMRTSSSLVNSLISVLFPLRLQAAGASSAHALSEYGIVYGMVMPVLMIPSTLIGSIALVLVPEFSECYYKHDAEKLSALVEKAVNATLLIAGLLIPFYLVCGEDVGVLLYGNAVSGKMIASSALILLPMSITLISTSLLNSMNCEKQTLLFFLLGAAAMLTSVWVLPQFLSGGALLVGMAADYCISASCSLWLLRKKTGSLRSKKYFFKLVLAAVPVILVGMLVRGACFRYLGFFPALVLTMLAVGLLEVAVYSLLKLLDVRALLARFFGKKEKTVRQPRAKMQKT